MGALSLQRISEGTPLPLISSESPDELFMNLVRRAMGALSAKPSALAEFYLVSLLRRAVDHEMTRPSAARSATEGSDTLAEAYAHAQTEPHSIRLESLQRIGDCALFISGFFPESFTRSIVKPRYYHRMGRIAYASIAEMSSEEVRHSLFRELAENFAMFVSVLGEVSEYAENSRRSTCMEMYEKWLWTRCPASHKRLLGRGFIPVEPSRSIQ